MIPLSVFHAALKKTSMHFFFLVHSRHARTETLDRRPAEMSQPCTIVFFWFTPLWSDHALCSCKAHLVWNTSHVLFLSIFVQVRIETATTLKLNILLKVPTFSGSTCHSWSDIPAVFVFLDSALPVDDFEFRTEQFLPVSLTSAKVILHKKYSAFTGHHSDLFPSASTVPRVHLRTALPVAAAGHRVWHKDAGSPRHLLCYWESKHTGESWHTLHGFGIFHSN